ncbi:hypothetical protein V474_07785 [Novosphingobium barchaimii LL02]|uniref:Uncharacterized protein n=1 Tax=Novosphingobium barchaimii LL02 TaxID=1114963 RepID=A0A0J8B0Q9_9SPHN|nr:hypothetical protein [Novosphingobium barchaimii]KMS59985.1 hypothetical protein V474_07785 [Novosphingobium barchaimii LL02]
MTEEQLKEFAEQGMSERGWIANSYAQIEYLLGDLIVHCREFPLYITQTGTVSHSAAKRVKKVRDMLALDGPLSPYSEILTSVLDAFEGNHEVRNLLAHGFCVIHHTPTGDAGFVFRKFDRDAATELGDDAAAVIRTFRLVDLQYHRAQMVDQAQQALAAFVGMYNALGWAGP